MLDGRRVYIIDDDTEVRTSLTFLLQSAGFVARPSSSGAAFLEVVRTLPPGCILLDVRMPGLDGIEVIKALADLVTQFPVIMMTGHGDIATAVRAMKLGAVDFLEKPFSDTLVLETLANSFQTLDACTEARNQQVSARSRLAKLTPRELNVLTELAKGSPNKVIAFRLGLSVRTVEMYRGTMMDRLEVKSLPEALRLAFAAGMLDADAGDAKAYTSAGAEPGPKALVTSRPALLHH